MNIIFYPFTVLIRFLAKRYPIFRPSSHFYDDDDDDDDAWA